jgi:hypothetical protein
LTILALVLFVLMMMIGGSAIDIMRFEHTRVALQNTLDRSTLAAASLTQRQSAAPLVRDYFEKAGLDDYLTDVTVTSGLNFNNVKAKATSLTETPFLGTVGVPNLVSTTWSEAEQRVTNVEIILVLDVSGSMDTNRRLINLKAAANEFVRTVLENDTEERITIGIVPFNGQVNLGANLAARYTTTDNPGVANVNCFDFPYSAFSSMSVSTSTPWSMAAAADASSSTNTSVSYLSPTSSDALNDQIVCKASAGNIVQLPTNNIATLQARIASLDADGTTSINYGMKWGVALVDPGSRSVFTQSIASSAMPSMAASRPFDYTDPEAMKVIVLMTDGEMTSTVRAQPAVKSGLSPIWRSSGDGNFSIEHLTGRPTSAGTNTFYVPHRNQWQATAWNSGGGVTRQTWPQVWARLRMTYVAWQYYAMPLGTTNSTRNSQNNAALNMMRWNIAVSDMNPQLTNQCSMARGQNIIIYGIAFEAPAAGRTAIASCASSPSHYFNANGLEISTAFRSIASNISQLRLK